MRAVGATTRLTLRAAVHAPAVVVQVTFIPTTLPRLVFQRLHRCTGKPKATRSPCVIATLPKSPTCCKSLIAEFLTPGSLAVRSNIHASQ
ncbi:hypothetical protein F2P81_023208 [Scophthalmus maximus]|uniref:Uncharacterized protein n=1 Tax=Scophthalmus maximus TaxID=52904 RepID=A0A6A4RPB9_SCOMX|nr:hypothetical protein F2P81_023208 [Scophthalmus maximus]